jgi:TRAP-type C4-dicarboxylate transport system substrate-binding protein
MRFIVVALTLVAVPTMAAAEPTRLRISTVSPEGTAWTRELRAFQREIDERTHGDVQVKWYLGAVAGDDPTALERVRHGQLDGIGGSMICGLLAPTLWTLRVVGLFHNRQEVEFVLGRLKGQIDDEFRKSGFTALSVGVFGADVLFSKKPVRSLADMRAQHWWIWDGWRADKAWALTLPALGVRATPGTLEALAPALTRGEVEGFIAVPSVALGFQWSPLASYFTDLPLSMLPGCLVVANSALDPLPLAEQQAVRDAGAKLRLRWNDTTSALDQTLVDRLFEKQGLKKVPMSPAFRAELDAAARVARQRLGAQLVDPKVLAQVEALLAEYRAAHPDRR